jgi:hypothetical protein
MIRYRGKGSEACVGPWMDSELDEEDEIPDKAN